MSQVLRMAVMFFARMIIVVGGILSVLMFLFRDAVLGVSVGILLFVFWVLLDTLDKRGEEKEKIL